MKSISLAAARTDAELTQEESAKALDISKSTYISYEKGRTQPSLEMAARMANLFGFELNEIRFSK